jgi:hypothetical protein
MRGRHAQRESSLRSQRYRAHATIIGGLPRKDHPLARRDCPKNSRISNPQDV